MTERYRSHTCGELRPAHVGQTVTLLGWVHRVRDLGGVLFFDVRDRHGLTQAVIAERNNPAVTWDKLRPEFVVRVSGVVKARDAAVVIPNLATGEIEVVVSEVAFL